MEIEYFIDFADNYTSKYSLIGQVANIQRINYTVNDTRNFTIQNSSIFQAEPPCHIKINEGAVKEIICPKIASTVDNRTNTTKTSTLPIPQQDALFSTLRYLLPRLKAITKRF